MIALYDKVSPFLRHRRAKTADEAVGKTDTICGALALAFAKGVITKDEQNGVEILVQEFLERHGCRSFSEYAKNHNWWSWLSGAAFEKRMQGYRHAQLMFYCGVYERHCKKGSK